MKKFLPFILSLASFFFIILLWDKIKLPYDYTNTIYGDYYYKAFNPNNDLIRFLAIILLPCLVYLTLYFKIEQETLSFKVNDKNYFLNKDFENKINKIPKIYLIFFFVFLILEFCIIDFKNFLFLDKFHDTIYLTPPINYLSKKSLFISTLYDYGLIGNNLGLIFFKLFGFYSLGSIKFIQLILIFCIKCALVLISKLLFDNFYFNCFLKKIFFLFFTFTIISLPDYYDLNSYFSPRSFLYLIFIYLVSSSIIKDKNNFIFFICGLFSSLSLLWWFDIGFYINFIIIVLSIFLLIHKKSKQLFFLLFGIFFSWVLVFFLFSLNEIEAFFSNLKFIFDTTSYLIGLEYLKPFSSHSGRWTRAIIIIYFTSIILININFGKRIKINKNLKLILNFIFTSGVILFNSALTRSDSYHLKYTAGLYTTVFIFLILYLIFFFIEQKKFFFKKIFFLFILIFLVNNLFYKFGLNFSKNISNISNISNNINYLLTADKELYFKKNDLLILEKYKKLSSNDDCLQYFSDDNYFPYYINKPTCTKFYISNQLLKNFTDKEFFLEFEKSLPQIILFDSPSKILLDRNNFSNILHYIENRYYFYEDYNGYIFYKRKL